MDAGRSVWTQGAPCGRQGPPQAAAAGDVLAGSTQGARHCGSGERTYLDVFAQFNALCG